MEKIGYGPKKENEQVWNEFRAALNKFYGKKREFFGDLKKTHKTNKDKKLAIIEKAESIAAAVHDSWDDVTKKCWQLQERLEKKPGILNSGKKINSGKIPEAVINFSGKREHFSSRDAEQSVNLTKEG